MKRSSLVEKRDILLFDILEELKSINSKLENTTSGVGEKKEEVGGALQPPKKFKCKTCGKEYSRSVDVATCARKHKKEGGK